MKTQKSTGTIMLAGTTSGHADIRYVVGAEACDPVAVVIKGRKKVVAVRGLDAGEIKQAKPELIVYTHNDLDMQKKLRRTRYGLEVATLRKLRVKRVIVPRDFPVGVAQALEEDGVRVQVAKGTIFPERAVKTKDEIRKIRQSQHAAVEAMQAATRLIGGCRTDSRGRLCRRGRVLTSADVRTAIEQVLLAHGCTAQQTIVAGGKQAADPHCSGRGALRAHEAIVMDIFPRHKEHGYWGDLTRSVVKGRPHVRLQQMYDAVNAAQAVALRRVKAGVGVATIHRAAADELRRRGFETKAEKGKLTGFFHSTGHGVGLEIHEGPVLRSSSKERLRAGNVITVEPGLYYPRIGGIRIEDTVVVTRTGYRYLARCPRDFLL